MAAFRERWNGVAEFRATEHAGHATDLARRAVGEGFRVIAAAGGDGTVHEVAAGILSADSAHQTFAVVPLGSANDYAFSITEQFGQSELDDDSGQMLDVGVLRSSARDDQFFLESLGIGLTGEITVEALRIPHRQGLWLYGTAAWRVLRRRGDPPLMSIAWDDEPPVATKTRLLSILIGRREGNFLMAGEALLDDGLFDVVHGGDVGYWESLRLLPRFLLGGPPKNHPRIDLRRCRRLTITSPDPLSIHTDGEVSATPADDVRDVELEILPSRLRVKVCRL